MLFVPPVLGPLVFFPRARRANPLSEDEQRRLGLLKQPVRMQVRASGFEVKAVDLTFTNATFSSAFALANVGIAKEVAA